MRLRNNEKPSGISFTFPIFNRHHYKSGEAREKKFDQNQLKSMKVAK